MRWGYAVSWAFVAVLLSGGCERIDSGAATSHGGQADEAVAPAQQAGSAASGDLAGGGGAPSPASPSASAGERVSGCPAGMPCEGTGSSSVGGAAGERCSDASDCASQVCGANGLCCDGSAGAPGVDCCASASDCPDSYRWLARCDDPATCQGSSGEATCIEHACGTRLIEDDAQCAATTDCGLFAPVACNLGLHDQPNAGCKAQCETDEDCHPDQQQELARWLVGQPLEIQEALLVTYYKQGRSYIGRFKARLAANPSAILVPGEGCRVFNQRASFKAALRMR